MAIIGEINEVLHKIEAKLYPNYLQSVNGAYIARTDDEASLSVEDVCAALKNRGGFMGSYELLVDNVRQFFEEMAYQLCDGFSVNTGFFSVHPRIGGTWTGPNEIWDREKHPVKFTFRVLKPLRDFVQHIEVYIDGIADTTGYISEFTDVSSEAVNETITAGGQFSIAGYKIKVDGIQADCGVYFVKADNPAYREKVSANLAVNNPGMLVGIIPNLAAGQWKTQVITQYSGSGIMLKSARTIQLPAVLTVA